MAFGRTYRPKRRAQVQPKRASSFKIKLTGVADFEQLSAGLQTAIAELQKRNIHGVQNCVLYCAPLGIAGKPLVVRDDDGTVVETFEIDMPGVKPEPGPSNVKRLSAPAVSSPEHKSLSAFNSARK